MADDKGTLGYIYPKDFFAHNKPRVKKGMAFVIMPFSADMNRVYTGIIAKAAKDCGITPVRADEVFNTKPKMISIMEMIDEAEVVIADLTGKNPNVFYELGMAHVVKDKVILLAQDIKDAPFDVAHLSVILYDPSEAGALILRDMLAKTFQSLGVGAVGASQNRFQRALDTLVATAAIGTWLPAANTESENVKIASLAYYADNSSWPGNSTQLESAKYLSGTLRAVYYFDVSGYIIATRRRESTTGWPGVKWSKQAQKWVQGQTPRGS